MSSLDQYDGWTVDDIVTRNSHELEKWCELIAARLELIAARLDQGVLPFDEENIA